MAKQIIDLSAFFSLTEERSELLLRTADVNTIRQHKEYKTYNPRYSHLNFEIDEDGVISSVNKKSLVTRIDDRLKSQGLSNPNSNDSKIRRKIGAVIMFSGSKDRIQEIAFGSERRYFSPRGCCPEKIDTRNFKEWAIQLRDFLCRRYSKKNLVAIIAHLDIARPEVIAIVLAIGDGKYFSYDEVFAGQDDKEYCQRDIDLWDELHRQVNVKWGLERGERHSVPDGHFFKATTAYVEMLQKMRDGLNEDIRNKTKELNKLNEDFAISDRRVKGLSTMLANLETQKAEIEAEIKSPEAQMKETDSLENIRIQKDAQIKKLDDILDKIRERQKQLVTARQQLQDVADQRAAAQKAVETLKKPNSFQAKKLHEITLKKMVKTIWGELLCHGKELYSNVISLGDDWNNIVRTERYRAPIEESDIELLIDNGHLLVDIATNIYVGDLGTANELAEENGLRPTTLERDKYFDNGEFMEKCFFEALEMVKGKNKEE